MPFPSFKSKKNVSSSPEITSQSSPLMYAQTPSAVDSFNTTPSSTPNIRPAAHKAISSDVFADITYYKQQKAAQGAKAEAEADAQTKQSELVVDPETTETQSEPAAAFERPTTPPQGSRSIPWESYRDLPETHPVFCYPLDVREKMYAKNIDPVVRAMADRSLRGKMYGEESNPAKGFYKRGMGMMNSFGTMSMGGSY